MHTKKNRILSFLTVLAMAVNMMPVYAAGEGDDNTLSSAPQQVGNILLTFDDGVFAYRLSPETSEAQVTGLSPDYSGDGNVTVPSSVTRGEGDSAVEYKVTEISESAFENNTVLTAVTFPNEITLGNWAFANCRNLKTVTFNSLVKRNSAFSGDQVDVIVNLGDANIPHGYLSQSNNFKSITVNANSLTFNYWCMQGDYWGDSKLKTITINSKETINELVWQTFGDHHNSGFTSVTIKSHVGSVGSSVFENLGDGSTPVTVEFLGGVDSISDDAFSNFHGGAGSVIRIHNNMADTTYVDGSFPATNVKIIFDDGEINREPVHDDTLYYVKEGDHLVVSGLYNKDAATITVPETLDVDGTVYPVTAIMENAFKGVSGRNVTVEGDIEVRGSYVNDGTGSTGSFGYISDTTVTFKGNNVQLKGSAFQGAKNLTVKVTGSGTLDLGQKAFAFAKDLDLHVGSGMKVTGSAYNVFQGVSGELEFLGGVESIGGYSFISTNISKLTTTTRDTYRWSDYGLSNPGNKTDVVLKAEQGKKASWPSNSWKFIESFTVDYDSCEENPQACGSLGNSGKVPVVINYNGGVGTLNDNTFNSLAGAAGSEINIRGESATVKRNTFPDDTNLTVNFDMARDSVTGVGYNDALTYTTFTYKATDYRKAGQEQKLLSGLIEDMGITMEDGTTIDLTQVASVQFQGHEVSSITVSGLIYSNVTGDEATDVGGKDFLLTSATAFTNDECVCIILKDGTRIKRNWTEQADKYNIDGRQTIGLGTILRDLAAENVFETLGYSRYYTAYGLNYYYGLWRVVDKDNKTIAQDYFTCEDNCDNVEVTDLNQIEYPGYGRLLIYLYGAESDGWVSFSSGYKYIFLMQNKKPKQPMNDGVFLYKLIEGSEDEVEIASLYENYAGDGNVTVPRTVELEDQNSDDPDAKKTYTVRSIKAMAFYNDARLKSVTFAPNAEGDNGSILLEGASLFYVPNLESIGGAGKVKFKANDSNAISDNPSLKSVSLHVDGSTVAIGSNAAVENIELYTDSLTVGMNTFNGMEAVRDLTIHTNTVSFGINSFAGADGIENLTIYNTKPVEIGAHAFSTLENLKTVTFAGGVTSIGVGAFEGIAALTTVNLGTNGDNGGKDLTIAKDAFNGCTSLVENKVTCKQTVTSADGTVTIAATETGAPLGAMLEVKDADENPAILAAAQEWYSENGYTYPIDEIVYKNIHLVTPAGSEATGLAADVLMCNTADNRFSVGHAYAFDMGTLEVFHLVDGDTVEHISTTDKLIYADGEIQKLAFHTDSMSPFGMTVLSSVYHDDQFRYVLDSSNPNAVKATITGVYDGDPENPVTALEFTGVTHDANKYKVVGITAGALNGLSGEDKTDAAIAANKAVQSITFTKAGIVNTLKKTSSGYVTSEDLFAGLTSLESVTFGESENIDIGSKLWLSTRSFNGCTSLKTFVCHVNQVDVHSTAFIDCSALETVIFTGRGTQKIRNSAFSSSTGIRYLRIDNPYDVEDNAFSVSNGTAFVQNNDSPLNGNMATKIGKFDTYVFAGIPWWVGDGLKGDVAKTVYFANGNLPGKDGFISMIRNAGKNLTDVYMDFDREDVSFADELDTANANVKIHYHNDEKTEGFYLDGVKGDDTIADGSCDKPFRTFAKLAEAWDSLTVDDSSAATVTTDTAIAESVNAAMAAVSVNKEAGTFTTTVTHEKKAFIKNTVTVTGEETWDYTGKDELVLNRDPEFSGVMVRNKGTLMLKKIVLDGGGKDGVAAAAPIINSSGTLSIQDGAVIRNNNRTEFGYPDKAGGIYASGSVTMDGGEISGNIGALGGGIFVISGTFNMTGGIICDNSIIEQTENYKDSSGYTHTIYYSNGGGVFLSHSTMNLSGGQISGNKAVGGRSYWNGQAGGGISVGGGNSALTTAILNMTGGTISGNTAGNNGGGIYIEDSCKAYVSCGYITNNTATGGVFGGGGIYVNGNRAASDGVLYLTDAVITDNTSIADSSEDYGGGGGLGGCNTSTTTIYQLDGAAIYGNHSQTGADLYFDNIYRNSQSSCRGFVTQYMFDGTDNHWTDPRNGEEVSPAKLASISSMINNHVVLLKSNPEQAPSGGKVFITGNTGALGGGVGSNGSVIIGRSPQPQEIKWTPEASKILHGRDMKEGEEFTFTVYEEKTSTGQNVWWTRYNDVQVGTGAVTGGKDGKAASISFTEISLGTVTVSDVGKTRTFLITEDTPAEDDVFTAPRYLAFTVVISTKWDADQQKEVYEAAVGEIEIGNIVDGHPEFDNVFSGSVVSSATYNHNFGRIRETVTGAVFHNYSYRTDMTAKKVWDYLGENVAPANGKVVFELYADDKATGKQITLDGTADENGEIEPWVAKWTDLPVYRTNANGEPYKIHDYDDEYAHIEYAIVEVSCEPTGYTPKLTGQNLTMTTQEAVFDFPHSYYYNTVTLQLYADGEAYGEPITLNLDSDTGHHWQDDPDGWKAVWPDLPVYKLDENGKLYKEHDDDVDFARITYTVKVIGYEEDEWNSESDEPPFAHDTAQTLSKMTPVTLVDGSASITNVYHAAGETTLKAVKTIENRDFEEGDEWTFTVTAAEGAPMPETTSITIKPVSGKTCGIDFGTIHYTEANIGKTYLYTITETGNVDKVQNDGPKTVEVKITDNGDGTLKIENSQGKESVLFNNVFVTPTPTPTPYTAEGTFTLNAVKMLEGREFRNGDRWTFQVTAESGVPMPEKTAVILTAEEGNSAGIRFGTIRYTEKDIGKRYTYTITESGNVENVENDTAKTVTVEITDNGDGTLKVSAVDTGIPMFTNKYREPARETVEVRGSKTWADEDNLEGLRPEQILVTLYANGEPADSIVASAKNNWSWSFTGLDKLDAEGNEIVYTIAENAVEGYVSVTNGYNLTNVRIPEQTTQTVTKIWDDMNNLDESRPEAITVTLQANGTTVRTFTLSEENGWSATAHNLQAIQDGQPVVYTWQEEEVPGYTATTEKNGNITVITNRHQPELTSRAVRKNWEDNNDELGLRPEAVTMALSNGTSVVATVRLTAANGWRAEVDNLPVTLAGNPVTYTWTERSVAGYTQKGQTVIGNETVFTNALWERPELPEGEKAPKVPGQGLMEIDDYDTPLALELLINHVGDCYE